jgi:hypothetical protein
MNTTPDSTYGIAARCAYIRGNGLICGGFALKNARYCYFHSRTKQSRSVLSDLTAQRRYEFADGNRRILMSPNAHKNYDDLGVHLFQALNLPALTDASSCLVALDAVTQALATHQISARTATALKGLIRTAIMLHADFQQEQQEAREHPEQLVPENPERPPHHMSYDCTYDANGRLTPHPRPVQDAPNVDKVTPEEEEMLARSGG